MMYVRTRYLCAVAAACDAAVVGGGVPLQRYSWTLAQSNTADAQDILMALAANLALLVVAALGLCTAYVLARRGTMLMIRRFAGAYVRHNSARRTRWPR